ncbi:unnamed protein product [Zymoseptoria tritici ST99CH_3D7]|uniref:UBC core domain-containing protein n=2 Tax=Zymoseptoria tritici TaxID=1047171 RepID=A0A1X7RD26_ZYMT9|nr:unnamed protein product [Zymoseptoria tritici ST99CH_3D7]
MSLLTPAFTRQQLCVDFAILKHACPKGIYVAPLPEEPLTWTGVLFVRKGPYANAILRFQIAFADDYPRRPPVVTFQSDVFHPLVTPLTTYTYSTRDAGADTQSAADEQRLPPGGLSLRHGFPAWFQVASTVRQEANQSEHVPQSQDPAAQQAQSSKPRRPPHVIQLLQYLCVAFDTEEVLDSIPLDAAANAGAWHAWQSYRAKSSSSRAASVAQSPSDEKGQGAERSLSPKQQPGGARKPGEWNWQGVWEDRVRKSIQASASEHVLYGGENNDVIGFVKMDGEAADKSRQFAEADRHGQQGKLVAAYCQATPG